MERVKCLTCRGIFLKTQAKAVRYSTGIGHLCERCEGVMAKIRPLEVAVVEPKPDMEPTGEPEREPEREPREITRRRRSSSNV